MKRFLLSFLMLLTLINWLHTHAEAQAPTVEITGPTAANGAFDVTITFSEAVNGFLAANDISIFFGTITSGSQDMNKYVITIMPASGIPSVSVSIPANVVTAQDDGSPNTASNILIVSIDRIAPTVSITQPSRIQKMAFMTTIMFSEDVTGFDDTASDVTLSGTAASGASISAINPVSASVYEVTITPDSGGMKGDLVISVPEDAATDTAGNGNTASSMSATVEYNPNAPTVAISQPSVTQTAAFEVTVTFNEAVTGFMPGDIILTGVDASASIGTPTGNEYPVTITPTSDGTLTIFIAVGTVMDVDMDGNVASNEVTVEVDVSLPTVTEISAPSTRMNADAFDVTITFSEDVTGFVPSDLRLMKATAAGSWSSETPTTYTVAITPTISDGDTGTVTIQVPANVAQDSANRDNTVSLIKSVTVDRERPTVVSITAPSTPQNGDFPVTITFSEPVYKFEPGDLGVTGAAAPSSWTSGNDGSSSYTGTIGTSGISSSTNTNTVTISLRSGAAEDAVENASAASSSSVDKTVRVDKKKPTPTIAAVSGTKSSAFSITIDFDEDVSNFESISDISVSTESGNATGAASNIVSMGNNDAYTATITPSGMGTLRISVSAGAAEDDAGNTSVASANVDVSVDTSGPTPTITAPMMPQNGAFDVTIDFGEDVSNFAVGDLTVVGATKASNWQSGKAGPAEYTITLTPTTADGSTGTVTIDVARNAAQDSGNNPNEPASQVTVNIDKDAPTLTITAPTMDQNGMFDVTFTFDQDVSGFTPSDVTVTNANKANSWKSDTPKIYVLILTPTTAAGVEETVTIDVAADGATDAASNGNEAATQASVSVDKKRPTVSISGLPSGEQKDPFTLTITFDEDVTDFMTDDLRIQPQGLAMVTQVTGSGATYTATITPNANQEGNVTVRVKANAATDEAGNRSQISDPTSAIPIDTMAPTVSISGLPSGEQNAAFMLTITFNENVTGFAKADLTVTGEATATAVSGSGSGYTATITPNANQEGDVTVRVKANAVTDAAGNGNTVSDATDDIHIDTIAPTATITAPTTSQNGAFDVTIDFGEPVSGFVVGDLDVVGATKASNWKTNMNGPRRYRITLTPTAADGSTGTVTIDVTARVATDNAGNDNVAASRATVNIDKNAPTLTITAPTTDQNAAFDVTFTFDEDVSGFIPNDVAVTNANKAGSWKSSTATAYVLTLTPTTAAGAEEIVTIDVAANSATDAATNGNAAATRASVTVDKKRPTATISGLPTGEENDAFTLTITFDENVTGFATGDLTVTGQATATAVSGGPRVYTATITPNANQEGNVKVRVSANAVTDEAGNGNIISAATSNIHIDTIRPAFGGYSIPPLGQQLNAPFEVVANFQEDVSGLMASDVTVTGPATVALKSGTQGPRSYTLVFTPIANMEGSVIIVIKENAVTDNAGNSNAATSPTTVGFVDTIVPTATISGLPTGEENDAFTLTITFDEDVSGFAAADLTVTGEATATAVSGGPKVYTATITPNTAPSEGDVTVQVKVGTVLDDAQNSNPASAVTPAIHVDTTVPTVAISGAPTIKKNVAFDLTVTFSEAVNGFAVPVDLTLTGPATAALKSGSAGASVYVVTITPNATSEGNVTVQVNAMTVQDLALNDNTASAVTPAIHVDTIVPTVSVSGFPPATPEQNSPFTLTVTFSEEVNGFAVPADLAVTGPATAALASGADGAAVYTVTITPNATSEGDVTVTVNADTVQDFALNDNTASPETDVVHVDTIPPTVTVTDVPDIEKNVPFDLTVTFSEEVNGFAVPGDLAFTGPAVATLKSGSDGDAVYVVTITPNATSEGDVTVQVNVTTVQDFALNDNATSSGSHTIHVDTNVPTVAISGAPTIEKNVVFDLTVTFSEAVNGFAVPADLTLTGPATAALKSGSAGDSVYVVTITPDATSEGDVTVTVNATTVQDLALNDNTASAVTPAIHVDTIIPTVAIAGAPTIEKNVAFDLTVTFSEAVNGFAVPEDLMLTGPVTAALASGADGAAVYTVTITPNATSEGDVTVTVNADTVQDFALNDNTASPETDVVHVDTILPTVAIEGAPETEQNGAYDLTIRFSEPVNGFSVTDDLTVTLTPEPGVTSATPIAAVTLKSGAAGSAVYEVTVTPNATGAEGGVTVTVNANGVQDFATNENPVGSNAAAVHIDTIVPTVSVSGFPMIEKNVPYDLTVTFSELVNGFAVPADLAVTGLATAALASGADGAAVYTVTITPNATSEGDVTVTVNANTVQDFALNANPAASPETDVVHVDTIVPTVSVSGFPPASPEQNGPFTLTVTFSEEVNGFAVPADLAVTGLATAALASGADGAAVYTVTITPNATSEGDVTVTVNADTVQDFALNDNTASPETDVVHIDTIPPTVSLVVTPPVTVGQETGYPTQERNAPYTLTVTFLEPVNGFAVPGDLTITGPGTAALTGGSVGDSVYTVTITPNATSQGDVRVTVNATTVQDFATNPNPAGSSTVPVHIDTIPPTFTIEDTPVLQRRNDFFDIRVVFPEAVNDFRVPGDFVTSDLVTASLQAGADGASEYTVRMTPNEDVQGDLIIEINEESVQDFALNRNANSVATQQPVRIDTIAPMVEITDLPTGVKNEAFDVTITFAEVVNGFTTQDIVLVGPATVALIAGTDGDAIYTVRVTPNPNAMGNVTLQIPAAVVVDLAENVNLASLLTPPIAIDTNALTVELQDVPETVQLEAFSVMIVFSNDVNGFVLADIEIEGDAVILSSTLLGTGSAYTLNITPDENTDGDVIINVLAGVAQDAAGKSNAASVPQTIAVAPKWMPDASLRDAFRKQLNLGAGEDFTPQQLRAVTILESEMSGMSDLTGVEQAMALTTLVLPGNEITDITPLQRLTKLTTLNLAANAITDITPLSGLTALTILNLGSNSLTDISALEDLTNLTALDLSNNALTDISLLENFTQLTTLNLAGNRITDISALIVHTKLTTLNLNDNPIGDFTPLTGLTALTTLELGGTGLSSLNAISGLMALTALNLSDNSLTDIALLQNLTALTALNLSENTISSLTVLSGLTGLTLLNLNDNAIIDITPLSSLTRLTTLELADNAITSLTSLTRLTLLTRLDLSDNAITEVAPIVDLANLETLRLNGNPILNTVSLYLLTQRVRPVDIDIAVSQYSPWDVNEDGTVDALDSALVVAALGQSGDAIIDPRTDVNGDGTVDNADLTLVTTNLEGGVGGAPSTGDILSLLDPATLGTLDRATLETYLNRLRLESDGSLKYRNAIALLESLLAVLRPTQTRLLANYPNPFNPETWLPYELAVDSTVELFIYDARGVLVRHLEFGHQPAGYYLAKSRAAYWDGRNTVGERVATGIYFYQLRAGSISQLRKMVILK